MPEWDEFRRSVYESPGACGYTRKVDVFKPVIAAVNGWAVAAGLETALLADIRIVAENAVFGALERRWNIVAGDGMTVRLPLAVGYAKAMELIITGRPVDAQEALRIGLANEVVPRASRSSGRSSSPARSLRSPRERSAPTRRRWSETSAGRSRSSSAARRRRRSRCGFAATRTPSAPGPSRRAESPSGPITGSSRGGQAGVRRPSATASAAVTRSTSASPIAGKNGSASERSEASLGNRELPLAVPEPLAVVRHQVDAGQIGLGGHAALGERRDRRLAIGALGQLDHVNEPTPPLGPAVRAGQHEAVGIALAGRAAADRGQALAVERGDASPLGEQRLQPARAARRRAPPVAR